MAVTYSSLKIASITDGTEDGTWGTITNSNLTVALEEAIVGRATATFPTDSDYTLPWTDTYASQVARNYVLNVTGTISATRNLVVPSIEKPYIIQNNTTGGQSIIVKTAAGTGITVPNGKTALVYTDGTNVTSAVTYIPDLAVGSIALSTTLPVSSGGTGATTLASGGILRGNGTSAISTASAADIVSTIGSTAVSVATNVAGGSANRILYNTGAATTSYILAPTVTDTFLKWDGSAFTWAAVSGGGGGTVSSVGISSSTITVSGSPITSSGTITLSLPQAIDTSATVQFGEVRSTGNITAYYSSDLRLKDNVKDIEGATDKVNAIGGKTFDWKDEYIRKSGGEDGYFIQKSDFGVIAQDVKEVFPVAVRTRTDGTLAVDYEKLVALAFAAIKELSARVKELEAK